MKNEKLEKFKNELKEVSTKELKLHEYWVFNDNFFTNCGKEINLLILKEIRKRKLNKIYQKIIY